MNFVMTPSCSKEDNLADNVRGLMPSVIFSIWQKPKESFSSSKLTIIGVHLSPIILVDSLTHVTSFAEVSMSLLYNIKYFW